MAEWWKTLSALRFVFDRLHDSAPQRSACSGAVVYRKILVFRSTSLFFRMNFMAPMTLHAFWILAFISVSSFRSLDMMLPRYLKFWTK